MKVGLITFHAAHNFGSVLQAYATQTVLQSLGCDCEIINYRLRNQKEFYNKLYSPIFGKKRLFWKLVRLCDHKRRIVRRERFEDFITTKLRLTSCEYSNYQQIRDAEFHYDILVSGSDQVWNQHCTAEFYTEPEESIFPYYLAFGEPGVKRISFSSSFGSITLQEIEKFVPYLQNYDALSVREPESAEVLSGLLERQITALVDPTLMLGRDDWEKLAVPPKERGYLLVYTLYSYRRANPFVEQIKKYADKIGLDVLVIAPLSKINVKGVKELVDAGPQEFLGYVQHASLVITNSFHGTAFSINFGVPFYSYSNGKDRRALQLMDRLGLHDRVFSDIHQLEDKTDYSCDFQLAHQKLNQEREKARDFLHKSLELNEDQYADKDNL